MTQSPHELILASAGTGKTFRLTNRFLALLFAGVQPERILATTFTRKAAGEILDRVLERLVEASEDDAKRAQLAKDLKLASLDGERCRNLLAQLTRRLNTFQVRTIDSFFLQLVRLFALDLELPPNWSISDARVDERLRSEALQDVLTGDEDDHMLLLLRELSKGDAGRGVHQTLLDKVRNYRPAHLESEAQAWDCFDTGKGVSDKEIHAALATVEAAELPKTAKGEPNSNWVKARNTFLSRARDGRWGELVHNGLGKVLLSNESRYYGKEFPDELTASMAPVMQQARHQLLSELRSRNLAALELLGAFEDAYQTRKRSEGAYDFNDLPHALAPRTASALPLDERELDLWFRLDGKIDHLLLDEFQDTSPVQWRILQPIAEEIVAEGDGQRSFFCVGDVKQSIYSFRQAEPRLLAQLHEFLPGLEPEPMNESYRSSSVVLETVNSIFEGLADNAVFAKDELAAYKPALVHWSEGFGHHEAARKELPGAAFLVQAREKSEGEDAATPLLERAVDRVEIIRNESPGATVGVLTRTRKMIPQLIYRLRKRGIDASGEGGNELTDARVVLTYISLLQLADFPDDSAAAFHVATSPMGKYIGLEKEPADKSRLAKSRELRRLQSELGLGEFTRGIAIQVATDDEWSAWDKARFAQLLDLAYAFEANGEVRPSAFIDHLRSERVEAPGGSGVRVMTIHASKGLEFDAVVLPQLAGGFADKRDSLLTDRPSPKELIQRVTIAPPKEWCMLSPELHELYDGLTGRMVEDNLCVLYVAMTRAARRLELIVPWLDPDKAVNVPKVHHFLREALAAHGLHEADEDGVLWSHKNNAPASAWAEGLEAAQRTPATLSVQHIALAPSSKPRTLPRRSPSSEEGGGKKNAADALRSRIGSEIGTLVHACLEELKWIEDFATDAAALEVLPALANAREEQRNTALAVLRKGLATDSIRRALSREHCAAPAGCELEVRAEAAFTLMIDGESGAPDLWNGFIDRLVLGVKDGAVVWAEVIDYKSDQPGERSLDELVDFYAPQLRRYAEIVAQQYDLEPASIPMRLIFLAAGEVRTIGAPSRKR